jgi:flavin reductase (DIM6/NTAB) family NADH-FMN oxidoreductase RutF
MPSQHHHAKLQPVSAQEFAQAMRHQVSSVCVITTAHADQRYGLTATAVSSVCASPPRLLVCVNKSGATQEKIAAARRFCVNVVTENQEHIAKAFAGMMGQDFEKFSIGRWYTLATGSPALREACVSIDCELVECFDQHSHSIFVGEVVSVATQPGEDPLLYGTRRFRALRKTFSTSSTGDLEALHF